MTVFDAPIEGTTQQNAGVTYSVEFKTRGETLAAYTSATGIPIPEVDSLVDIDGVELKVSSVLHRFHGDGANFRHQAVVTCYSAMARVESRSVGG